MTVKFHQNKETIKFIFALYLQGKDLQQPIEDAFLKKTFYFTFSISEQNYVLYFNPTTEASEMHQENVRYGTTKKVRRRPAEFKTRADIRELKRYVQTTVEPRFNEVAGDRPNSFVKSRVRYIEVLFHIFYYYWGKEYRSLYRGFR